jgi:beta-lactamase superfamily II metal-dependent hydrolase
MKIQIFDVSHGFCAYLVADNGNVMLFDCGHNDQTGFRPSHYLKRNGCFGIEKLFITNFDEDHISDLPNIIGSLPISLFYRNRSISADVLRSIKLQNGPISSAMEVCLNLHSDYIHSIASPPEFPNIAYTTYHNNYPVFTDTNNLSVVTFISYDNFSVLFPGDLEKQGWLALLKNDAFKRDLGKVNIFVASHHGREGGYCEEVFNYCKPELVIISDKEIIHETQKQLYQKHAIGIPWDNGQTRRYVLTTRSDGMVTITKTLGQGAHIQIGV